MKLKRRNFLLEIIIGIFVIYSTVLIILFIFQRNLMYHPDENNYFGDKLEVSIEKVKIKASKFFKNILYSPNYVYSNLFLINMTTNN